MYEVIVGNIGSVYNGPNRVEANRVFGEYKRQSKINYGRAAGEDVVLMTNGEPTKEFVGSITKSSQKKQAEEE
jgi:hypothetical protein